MGYNRDLNVKRQLEGIAKVLNRLQDLKKKLRPQTNHFFEEELHTVDCKIVMKSPLFTYLCFCPRNRRASRREPRTARVKSQFRRV